MVASTVLAAVSSRPRWFIVAIPTLSLALVLFDINRLQPWIYQYTLMFLALTIVNWGDSSGEESRSAIGICGVVLAFLYIWSGIQKLNPVFATGVFPWLLEPISKALDLKPIESAAYVFPILECLTGVLLLVSKTRTLALIGLTVMHLCLLYLLGPFGHNYNAIVWPWNIAMIAMAWIVFYRNNDAVILPSLRPHLGRGIAILVAFMPALNFFGKWDAYLSASLYSGRNVDAWFILDERAANELEGKLSQAERRRLREAFDGFSLDATKWSLSELNVPLYPERRVFEALATRLRRYGTSEGTVTLYVTKEKNLFDAGPDEFEEVKNR